MTVHTPVLLNQILKAIDAKEGDIIVDATLGGGGYIDAVCGLPIDKLTLVGIDADQKAIERVQGRLKDCKHNDVFLKKSNNVHLDDVLDDLEIDKVDAFMFDLGLSSDQLEKSGRGFSFLKDEPLMMTFSEKPDPRFPLTAYEIVNKFDEEALINILKGYGEEKYARRIARGIIEARKAAPIRSTSDLIKVINESVPAGYKRSRINPATKTFQALRIATNNEIENLEKALRKAFERLKSGGKIAVVSFHSLEDRIVKKFFKEMAQANQATLPHKKPIAPDEEEVAENPRARSAKLRVIIKN